MTPKYASITMEKRGNLVNVGMTLREFTSQFKSEEIEKHVDRNGYHNFITGHGDPMDIWDRFHWPETPQNDPNTEEPLWTTPYAIRHINPDVKLILMVRDPVNRLYSHYFHAGMGTSAESFHKHIVETLAVWRKCLQEHTLRSCIYSPDNRRRLKIDETCVELMSEEQLQQYVPKYGDRLAVRGFLSNMKTHKTQFDRKQSLLERLRCKLQKKSPEEQPEPTSKLTKLARKSSAEKPDKKVGIGMMMFDMKEQCYHQLRVKSGGGTRTISVSKYTKKDDLLIEGRKIFFPNNISPRYGSADEYHFDIMDYQGIPLDNTVTVQDVSDITKLSNLRFYLAVKWVSDVSDISTCSGIGTTGLQSVNDLTFETIASTSSLTASEIGTTGSHPVNYLTFETTASTSSLTGSVISTTGSRPVDDLTFETTDSTSSLTGSGISTTGSQPVDDLTFETTARTSSLTGSGISTTGSHPVDDLTFETTASTSSLTGSGINTIVSQPIDDLTFETTAITSLPDLSTETNIDMDMFLNQLDRPHGHEEQQHNVNRHVITLHRGHVFKELRTQFSSGNFDLVFDMFTIEMILPNGEPEIAADSGGVIRDALVEFWESFYEECTLGREYKVPFLRHDYTPVDWNAIARVLFFGWKEQKYFPVQLSKAFMSCCVYGMDTYASSQETLLKEFMSYIPLSESKTIASSLEGDFDNDELLEILGNHECRVLPTPDNLKQVLGEIAHKELIQQPMYIKECWFNQLNALGFDLGSTSLDSLYKKLIPDNRKVGKILRFPDDMSTTQTSAANLLKKFVRELEPDLLAQFLRFCTGSDLLLMDGLDDYKTISVRFTNLTGICRRPVAHTCGRVLEIPEHYDSYLEFRSEFMSVLKSNIWVMDFV